MKNHNLKKCFCSECGRIVFRRKRRFNLLCCECQRVKNNARQREKRRRNNNMFTRKYEKTPNGFLMRLYRNMQSRVKGIQYLKKHLYQNCEILDRQEFYQWAKASSKFWELYNQWIQNDYERKLTPTVNRIDSEKGYVIDNMEWLTHSENSRLGSLSQKRKKKI